MKKLLLSILLIASGMYLFGQGVTTSSANGRVLDNKNNPVPFATVVALHEPSGTTYGTTTRDDGGYNLPNIRSGGPYTITVSFLGYKTETLSNIYLTLGESHDFVITLNEEGISIDEIVVVGVSDKTFNSGRTGANTNVSQAKIQQLPSISRSLYDYARLTPQATVFGSGISFAGSNNRYNSFLIDGTVNNDVFGLAASGTNGGQAGTQPVSLDAIEEIQVVIAPFDVRQGGFTGGGINAITKRGTNRFSGTAYFFGNNQSLVGKTPTDDPNQERLPIDDYSDAQMGLSLGGPIVQNKVFFFLNAELTNRNSPTTNNIGSGSEITLSEAQAVESKLIEIFGSNQGGFNSRSRLTKSNKVLARLDWNMNEKHKMTLRHSFVNANYDNFSRGRLQLAFNESGYIMKNNTNSTVLELHSRFSNKLSNELRIGYTVVRDDRSIMGNPAPYIRINLTENRYIETGSEQYSTANYLNQDVFTFTNNFSLYSNKHTFTFGTHNEFFTFENLFIRQSFGAYQYFTLNDFLSIGTPQEALPRSFDYSYSDEGITGSKNWAPVFNAMQLGFFAQDEYRILKSLKITGGVRVDIPIFTDKPSENVAFNSNPLFSKWDVATNQMPKTRLMWSPRFGFNWDVTGDRSTQVRGGTGIFTGRVPFVWVSNQFSNTGIEYKRTAYSRRNAGENGNFPLDFNFNPDPDNQLISGQTLTSEINVIDPEFKFPQVFRSSIAIDQKLPFGIKGTIEGIYSRKLNDIDYKNINREVTGTILSGPDQRPTYSGNLSNAYTNVIYLTNTSKGYSYNITGMLEKDFKFGLNLTAGYTYGIATDVNSGSSSQAYSNWRYNEQWNGSNSPELSYADYDTRHRIVGGAIYKIKYSKMATTIGIYYNGQTGNNFSYIYYGDINGDGQNANDLVFIPTDSQIDNWLANGQIDNITGASPISAADQAVALKEFLGREPYLKGIRGKYAERNGATTPFVNLIDLRFVQEIQIMAGGQKNTLQFTLDVVNLANLINKDWGRVYSAGYNYSLLNYRGLTAQGAPRYTFTPVNGNVWSVSDFSSRWRAQFGLRYIFN